MHFLSLFLAQPEGLMPGSKDKYRLNQPNSGKTRNRSTHADSSAGLEPLLENIRQKHGDKLLAILVYGSWLRGKRDTMLDFYVLVEDYRTLDSSWQGLMCRLLPPNVYHIYDESAERDSEDPGLRAKYALLTLERFQRAMQHDFHSYFWARFAQACEILYVRDESTALGLAESFKSASATFIRRVVPAMQERFSSKELWTRGLSLTYQCELRTENRNRGESIYAFNPAYYDDLTRTFAVENMQLIMPEKHDIYSNRSSAFARKISPLSWWLRRFQGKLLSALRLLKAAFTFNQPLEYLLWKIERHSGLYIEPSHRQIKHPLVFAWPLLWRLYRKGAFR